MLYFATEINSLNVPDYTRAIGAGRDHFGVEIVDVQRGYGPRVILQHAHEILAIRIDLPHPHLSLDAAGDDQATR